MYGQSSLRGHLVTRACARCGTAFTIPQAKVKGTGGQFCSVACSSARKRRVPDRGHTFKRNCNQCGKPYLAKSAMFEAGQSFLCSRRCANTWRVTSGPDQTERFWSKVDRRGPDECWPWTGTRDRNNYGIMTLRPKGQMMASRFMLKLQGVELRPGGCALHRCDNPPCVNPAHLFVGTKADNCRDRTAKGRTAKGDRNGSRTRPERLRRGESSSLAKLTEQNVIAIRQEWRNDASPDDLAAKYGVSRANIYSILTRRTWRHLPE